MVSQVDQFQSLGFTGKDVRHIGVHVQPAVVIVDGAPVETHKIFIGNGDGEFAVDFPTDLIFASMTEGWVFERFALAGRDWDGIAVLPDDGDFSISFGDEARKSVVVQDVPAHFFTHRYQIVMHNAATDEVISTDPSIKNGDAQGLVGS